MDIAPQQLDYHIFATQWITFGLLRLVHVDLFVGRCFLEQPINGKFALNN